MEMDEATKNMLKTFRDVVVHAHELFNAPLKPETAAMKVSDMFVQFLFAYQQANAIKEQGPGIRLDFSKFVRGMEGDAHG